MKFLNIMLVVLLVIVVFVGVVSVECDIWLWFLDMYFDGYFMVEGVKVMVVEVKEKIEGCICIEVFFLFQLGEEKDIIEQIQFGVIDMICVSFGLFNDIVLIIQIVLLFYLYKFDEYMYKVMDGFIGEEIVKVFEEKDLVLLVYYDGGVCSFYNLKKLICIVEDLKGLKFCVMQNDVFVDMMLVFGVLVMFMLYGEVYFLIQIGVIDGVENNFFSYDSLGYVEVVKYFMLDQYLMVFELVVVFKISWEKLIFEDQVVLCDVVCNLVMLQCKLWVEQEKVLEDKVMVVGVEIIKDVDKIVFVEVMVLVYEKYVIMFEVQDLVKCIQVIE